MPCASDYPFVSYVSPNDISAAGGTAQDYMDGVLKYWNSQLEEDNDAEAALSQASSDEMETDEPSTPSTITISPSSPRMSQPVVPQLQDYQQQLFALEHDNKRRISVARERQRSTHDARIVQHSASRKGSEQAPIEGYRSYLLSKQVSTDSRLHRAREEQEVEERKQELERLQYMRRKDSGIYCETIYGQKGYEDDSPIPEEDEGCEMDDVRRDSRIDTWVHTQTKRGNCGLIDEAMLPMTFERTSESKLPLTPVGRIFDDFKYQLR